jgi:ribonuclease P protein component
MHSIAGQISRFTQKEASELFKCAYTIARNSAFNLLAAPQQKSFGRVLLVTPRRIGNASQRNKLRRRAKAIFYEEKLFECGRDYILIFKKRAITLSFDQLRKYMLEAFDKIPIEKE